MRKHMLVFLAATILLSACAANPASAVPTPTIYAGYPTPKVAYQIIGGTKNIAIVVVDPASNKDRQGLQAIGDYLCNEHQKCKVWFWDDITKADPTYPFDPEKEQYIIAYYTFDWQAWASVLKVYTLGDPR